MQLSARWLLSICCAALSSICCGCARVVLCAMLFEIVCLSGWARLGDAPTSVSVAVTLSLPRALSHSVCHNNSRATSDPLEAFLTYCIWPCLALCHYLSRSVTMSRALSLSVTLCHALPLCLALCHYLYHYLTFCLCQRLIVHQNLEKPQIHVGWWSRAQNAMAHLSRSR